MEKDFRIVHVFAGLDRGGAETMIMNLYRNIDRNIIQFDFIVNDSNKTYDYENEILALGGKIFRVPRLNLTNYKKYKNEFDKILENNPEIKIAHCHYLATSAFYFPILRNSDIITIAHSHIAGTHLSPKNIIKFFSRKLIKFQADYLFACSLKASRYMFGFKYQQAKILYNSIDLGMFKFNQANRVDYRKEFDVEDRFVIGHIGRFDKQKNHRFILKLFKVLYEKDNSFILFLIGEGKLKNRMLKLAHTLNVEKGVRFLNNRNDISQIMNMFDVFILPSLYEGLPVTAIEAQSNSLLTLVSNKVTSETSITNNIKYLPINKGISLWVDELLDVKSNLRHRIATVIQGNNYDVIHNSNDLKNTYLKILFENKPQKETEVIV
ncbi:MAG: glycosyltransferase [Acholeplasmataceae bacterium]|nr:glycosyltransferase [Acholeplasmataceae bacterium]